jgi:hypothetical protein
VALEQEVSGNSPVLRSRKESKPLAGAGAVLLHFPRTISSYSKQFSLFLSQLKSLDLISVEIVIISLTISYGKLFAISLKKVKMLLEKSPNHFY